MKTTMNSVATSPSAKAMDAGEQHPEGGGAVQQAEFERTHHEVLPFGPFGPFGPSRPSGSR